MIEFTCPGCLSQCVANEAFTGMKARCVVCGAFIRIPAETGQVATPLGPVPSGPLPARSAPPPKPSRARADSRFKLVQDDEVEDEDEDEDDEDDDLRIDDEEEDWNERDEESPDDVEDEHEAEEPAVGAPAKGAAKESGKKGAGTELDGKLAWDDFPDEVPPAEIPDAAAAKKRKRQRMIIGGSVAAALVITAVLAFSGSEKPFVPPPQETTQAPPPSTPPKPPEVKKEPPPPVHPVAPLPRNGGPAARFVASQLIAERAVNPVAFDKQYQGQPFLLAGAFSRVAGGLLFLNAGPDGVGGVTCVPLKVTRKPLDDPLPELKNFTLGQLVTVRGWYGGELRLTDCTILGAPAAPADGEYLDRDIDLVGTVLTASETDGSFPTVNLAPTTTDSPVSVRCLFRPSEQERVAKLRPGQTVTIRGHCEGRTGRVVKLHNCSLLANSDPPGTGIVRVPAGKFFAVYEAGLLPFQRPDLSAPVAVLSADDLAAAYATDPRHANATYLFKPVEVTGTIDARKRDPKNHTLVLETGTEQPYQVFVALMPNRFGSLRDRQTVTLRGVCVGLAVGPGGRYYPRIENGEPYDADAGNPALRTTAEFLPFRKDQTLTYHLLKVNGHTSPFPVNRFSLSRGTTPNTMLMTPLRVGNFLKDTLFGTNDPPVRPVWTRDLTKQKGGSKPAQIEFRIVDDTLEVREKSEAANPEGFAAFGGMSSQEPWWDPVLKIGYGKGETWTTKTPDGRVVTYKVLAFEKDAEKRDTVVILRVMKDPTDVSAWDETISVYTHGIGEVRRIVKKHSARGKTQTLFEVKLVDTDTPDEVDPKANPNDPKPEPKAESKTELKGEPKTEPKAGPTSPAPDKKGGQGP